MYRMSVEKGKTLERGPRSGKVRKIGLIKRPLNLGQVTYRREVLIAATQQICCFVATPK